MAVPPEFSAAKTKADGAFRSKDYEAAAAIYSEALEVLKKFEGGDTAAIDSDRLKIHSNRSLTYQKLQKGNEALKDAKKAVALDTKRSKSWFRLGQTLMGLDLFGEAVTAFEVGCRLDPRWDAARSRRRLWARGPTNIG